MPQINGKENAKSPEWAKIEENLRRNGRKSV